MSTNYLSYFSFKLFSVSVIAWLTVLYHYKSYRSLQEKEYGGNGGKSSNVSLKNHITSDDGKKKDPYKQETYQNYPELTQSDLTKHSSTSTDTKHHYHTSPDDPIVQIDREIIRSEVSPVVKRIQTSMSVKFQSLVIGIAGGSGSGKTTLSRAIVDALGEENIAYISHDSYYKDLSHLSMAEREVTNFDDPNSLDTWLLTKHVEQLKSKHEVEIPIYSFTTHSRTKEVELLKPRPIILVEGILIFTDPQLINLIDIKIFVDTDDDIRLIRRMERDVVERGRSVQKIIEQYLRTVRPMHLQHVQPSKKNADIIVPFGINSVALDLVISKLKRVLADSKWEQDQLNPYQLNQEESDKNKNKNSDSSMESEYPYIPMKNGVVTNEYLVSAAGEL